MSNPEFVELNPWWVEKNAIDQDPRAIEWETSRFKWIPRLGATIQWNLDIIYVLRGPRQVGKTTMMKLRIRELLKSGIDPRHVFYWPCDLVESPEKLASIITSFQDFARKDKTTRLYIIIDEVSSVRDWQKGIKSLYDSGRLRHCTVVLTGSHSIDLRRATETLAGRRGEVSKLRGQLADKILLPTKFSEYADTRSEKVRDMLTRLNLVNRPQSQSVWKHIMEGSMPRELKELQLISKEIQILFKDFLLTGGVPKVVHDYLSSGVISKYVYESYVDLLIRDITRWNGKEVILRQIIRKLAESLSTPISLNGLREETDISSHHTTGSYVDFLKDSYVATVIQKLDLNKGTPLVKAPRKVHFEDPFIFHALRAWSLGREHYQEALNYLSDPEKTSKLVESIVSNHLVRLLFSYYPSAQFDYNSMLFYWESSKQRSLDFVMRIGDNYLPVEMKYQNKISSDDANPIIDFQKAGKSTKGLLLTKDSLKEKQSYLEVPVHLALLLV